MKNSSNLTTLLTLSFLFMGSIAFAQTAPSEHSAPDPEPDAFEISIQQTDLGFELSCTEGCAWKTLSWGRINPLHQQEVDAIGTVSDENRERHAAQLKNPDLAGFLISFQKKDGKVELTCSKGCAWERLSYQNSKAVQQIDQFGMKE